MKEEPTDLPQNVKKKTSESIFNVFENVVQVNFQSDLRRSLRY